MRKCSLRTVGWLRNGCAEIASAIILSIILAGSASAQSNSSTTTLTLTSRSRPVMQMVLDLISKCGCVITYEDPRYVYEGDLRDATQEHRHLDRLPSGGASKVLVPLGGSLQLTVPSGTSQLSDQATNDLLQQLVQSWFDSNQGGGRFQVRHQDGAFHVVPTEVRDPNGNWQAVQSILTHPITLPTESRDDWQTYKAIGQAIGAAANVKLVTIVNGGLILGGSPFTDQYVFGAQNEPADDVLMQAFKLMGKTRTWFLTYEPTRHVYFLNIDDVAGLSDVH